MLFKFYPLQAALQFVTFFLDRADCFGNRELLLDDNSVKLRLEFLYLRLLRCSGFFALRS
ncbi:hypothetical protein [Pseudomonas aeruginosa]|uniref:hypothetical protein n=1 Tax=Pseudomonas aeruginosa TaxID=287 RepID=UPI001EF74002|nr:hypothetical protein [Pseudomonas aeruginosa]